MRKFFLLLGLVFLAGAIGLGSFIPAAYFSVPTAGAPSLSISIPAHADASTVATILKEKGIVVSTLGYRVYAILNRAADHPREGSYSAQPGMSYRTLASIFALGPAREETDVQIIEGWTLKDEARVLGQQGVSSTAFVSQVGDVVSHVPFDPSWRERFPFLMSLSKGATLEGYLFPNTYRVYKDQLPEGLIKKQLDEFAKLAPGLAEEAKSQGRTLEDVVILASIVEKEVRTTKDRGIVAGIFLNRMKEGMALQSDATINYITDSGRSRSTLKDLEVVSPYNTYRNTGLPPGPICNPSEDALLAAVHPTQTSYRYFVTDPGGEVYYASTYEGHQKNRVKAFGK